ncbi:hypothetical protein PVAND_016204 [Polypedilum vanderplanki]|uniref:Uncharacterized protein n=1 Tax=Polypedilum vanderplanki TaxID=319348 RepID=A0A9J6BEF1_POLVA|nr:hypothetical protein PVAND_016204 [Polypedilum vanderplanki]
MLIKFYSFLLLLIPSISAINISCHFRTYIWNFIGSVYECHVSDLTITSLNTVITSANGTHYNSSMNHEKVTSFHSDSKDIHYMPHGLNKIFPNLVSILIANTHIKEIHQKDLEQYPKLKLISLYGNEIEYLEKDLFKFNTQLKYIFFHFNKINQIYPTIFDHLNQLECLFLSANHCVNKDKTDKSGVIELIKEVKENCLPSNYSLMNQLEDLKGKMNMSNFESFLRQFIKKSSNLESKMENMTNKQNEKLKKSESNLNQKVESTAKKITNEIHTLMKQQEQKSMAKFDEQFAAVSQNLKRLKNQFESEILKKQNEKTQTKPDEQKNELDQKLKKFKSEMFHQFFFIALPSICLFTSLNIVMIYLCYQKYAKIGKVQKSRPSNDVELEERNN